MSLLRQISKSRLQIAKIHVLQMLATSKSDRRQLNYQNIPRSIRSEGGYYIKTWGRVFASIAAVTIERATIGAVMVRRICRPRETS
jgi:hypothetical protein